MAIYHLSAKVIKRSEGRSATAAAAYRAGVEIHDGRTGTTHDYSHRRGVEYTELILPDGASMERAAFWNAVEVHHRRRDAVLAREVEVALPAELNALARRELAMGFASELANRYGVAADVAIHAPGRRGDQRNHHSHILLSACYVGPDGALGKKAAELDPIHCKRRGLDTVAEVARERWAELCNSALEHAGVDARVDHRGLEEQGVDRLPGIHLGPAASTMERRGVRTDRGDQMREIAAANAQIADIAQALEHLVREQQQERQEAARRAEAERLAEEQRRAEEVRMLEEEQRRQQEAFEAARPGRPVTIETPQKRSLDELEKEWQAVVQGYYPAIRAVAEWELAELVLKIDKHQKAIGDHEKAEPPYPKGFLVFSPSRRALEQYKEDHGAWYKKHKKLCRARDRLLARKSELVGYQSDPTGFPDEFDTQVGQEALHLAREAHPGLWQELQEARKRSGGEVEQQGASKEIKEQDEVRQHNRERRRGGGGMSR